MWRTILKLRKTVFNDNTKTGAARFRRSGVCVFCASQSKNIGETGEAGEAGEEICIYCGAFDGHFRLICTHVIGMIRLNVACTEVESFPAPQRSRQYAFYPETCQILPSRCSWARVGHVALRIVSSMGKV